MFIVISYHSVEMYVRRILFTMLYNNAFMFYFIWNSFAGHSCIVHVVLLHCILNYMFSLLILIIVNIVFVLFYLQIEPVFYLRTIKSYPNHFLCHQYRQQFYNIGEVCSPDVYIPTVMSLDDVRGNKQSASQRLWSTL